MNRKKTATRFEALKIWSGLYLAFFLCFHISAVLVGKNILNLDTNFYFGAAGLNTFPFVLFFGPYYTLAIVSFFGHVAGIHALKMRRDILGFDAKEQAWVILIFGVLLSFLIIFGLTAGFQGVHIPDEFLFSF